jgi:outer membrane receptor for monomeric catechols
MKLSEVLYKAHQAGNVPSAKDDAKAQRKFLVDLVQLDSERVYDSDIKKFFTWYNALKDILDFSKLAGETNTEVTENTNEEKEAVEVKEEKPKKTAAKKTATPKATAPKNTTPKTSTKGAGAAKTTYRPKSV